MNLVRTFGIGVLAFAATATLIIGQSALFGAALVG